MSTAGAAELTVIDLHNRTAAEVLPVLQPLVGADAAVSGMDYKLFVRGTAEDVARIQEALAVLDRTPRQLMVSVRYNSHPQDKSSDVGVAGTITNNGSQVGVRAGTTIRTASDSNISSVRVLEGNGAHIATGQTVPMVTAVLWPTRSNRQAVIGGVAMDYHEFSSGFDVLPRINGDRVLLDISTQQERAADSGQANSVQRATTTLAGRLGEWIELGGVTSSTNEQSTGITVAGGVRTTTTQSSERSIEVKVDEVQ